MQMKKLIFAATVIVFAFSYTTSPQAQTGTQTTKSATKTATQNPGATTNVRRAGGGCASARGKMSGKPC
jgi:hypothetical protein